MRAHSAPILPAYTSLLFAVSIGGVAAYVAAAFDLGLAYLNVLAIILFSAIAMLVAAQIQRVHETRSVALVLVLAGALFWYLYANAVAALLVPSRCLGWTSCFTPNEIAVTLVFLFLFLGAFLLTYVFARAPDRRRDSSHASLHPGDQGRGIDLMCALAVVAGLLPVVLSGVSPSDLASYVLLGRTIEKAWLPTSSNIGAEGSALLWGARFLLVAGLTIAFARLLTVRTTLWKRVLLLLAWFVPFVFQLLDSGTRYLTLLILLPGLILFVLQSGRSVRLIALALAAFCLVALSQFQLSTRDDAAGAEDFGLPRYHLATLFGSTDFFHETSNAVRLYETLRSPVLDNDVLIFATYLVPRSLWQGKPIPETVREYSAYRWGIDILSDAGNVFPGLIGQYLLSLGVLGPLLIGVCLGFVAAVIDKSLVGHYHITIRSTLPLACYSVGLFLSFRYLSPGYFIVPLAIHLVIAVSPSSQSRTQQG